MSQVIAHTKGKQKEDNRQSNKRFTMVYQVYGSEVDRKMSERAMALLTILIHRMEINTNIIVDRSTGLRMSLQDIADVIDWPKKKAMQVLEEIIDLGIIHKCRKGVYTYYIVDNRYAICGDIDKVLNIIEQNIKSGND